MLGIGSFCQKLRRNGIVRVVRVSAAPKTRVSGALSCPHAGGVAVRCCRTRVCGDGKRALWPSFSPARPGNPSFRRRIPQFSRRFGVENLGKTLKFFSMDSTRLSLDEWVDAADAGLPASPRRSRVAIRAIPVKHRRKVADHLLALSPNDRYLRFGYGARDEQINQYVDRLDFDRDEIYGIYNRHLALVAVAHLAYSVDAELQSCAEFGVSVLPHVRGRGLGARLFDRAMIHARNEGVRLFFIHALSENVAMLRIARKSGAVVERDGSESEAWLELQAASLDSRLDEFLDDRIAAVDYRLKAQLKQVRDLAEGVLQVPQQVRAALFPPAQ